METEQMKIFDENRNQIGIATRDDVHTIGYWHETFHCWFVCKENGVDYIWLQLRSEAKKEYPNLFDITVAGHLNATECVEDGVREIKEELGIDVSFHQLISLGIIHYCIIQENFIDKELANVFLYTCNNDFHDLILQKEEVSGIVKVVFTDFKKLWLNEIERVHVDGIKVDHTGNEIPISEYVGKDKFVPHEHTYYSAIIEGIEGNLD